MVNNINLWFINFNYFLDNFRHIIVACGASISDSNFFFSIFDSINIVKVEEFNESNGFNNIISYIKIWVLKPTEMELLTLKVL